MGTGVAYDVLQGLQDFSQAAHAAKRAYDWATYETTGSKRQKVYEKLSKVDNWNKRWRGNEYEEPYKKTKTEAPSKQGFTDPMVRPRGVSRTRRTRRRTRFGRRLKRYRRRIMMRPERGIRWGRLVNMDVVATYTFQGTTGSISAGVYKANSLNDPFAGSNNTHPLFLDQWGTLYQKYKVFGSTCSVIGHNTSSGAIVFGIALRQSATALLSSEHYAEADRLNNFTITSNDLDMFRLGLKYKPKKFWHLKNMHDADEQEGTIVTSATPTSVTATDPSNLCYYHVYIQDLVNASTVTAQVRVRLRYLVWLYDPVDAARGSV